MPAWKAPLVRPLHALALVTGASGWLARRQNVRRIVMLHGVGPEDLPAPALKAQLAWLARRFCVVPLPALVRGLEEGRPGAGEVALTFDDGLKNHVEAALPVLRRLGLPATFFVCPGLIESRRWLWNHEARARLSALPDAERVTLLRRLGAPGGDVEDAVAWMKSLGLAARTGVEDAIRSATPAFTPSAAQRERFDPLTWDDLASLDPALVTVGSHTLTHPILPTLDDATLAHELQASRALLERQLGRAADLFCYPNGSADARVRAAAARVYRAAVTTESGCVGPGAGRHALPRIPVAERVALLAWRLHRPAA